VCSSDLTLRAHLTPDQEMFEALKEMEQGLDSLNRLIRDILDFARPISLRYSLQPIATVVDRAISMLVYKLAPYDLLLDLQEKEKSVSVDADKIVRVLINLLVNSMEAMPGGGKITISSCFQNKGSRDYIFMSISDTGPGIPEQNLQHITEPFFTTKSHGTGLGLAICQKIIEAHRGWIGFRSKPGEGTTVDIVMPVTPP